MNDNSTIAALASAPGRAGVAVIRLSGRQAGAALKALCVDPLPEPRRAVLKSLGGIDRGFALWFPGPDSFTGEDVAELQVHGSRAVIQALLARLTSLPGIRLAGPGEFSRRAFLNGKMDLTEVEGLADLIDAETEAQRKQALRLMEGEAGQRFGRLRSALTRALARLEATIDFPEEEIPAEVVTAVMDEARGLQADLRHMLTEGVHARRIREGVRVVILGAPNAGKSSLMNALARRDAAIVSHIAGTTRDVIEVHLDIGGYAVTLVDTAGLRDSDDPIEQQGIERARACAKEADIRLVIFDGEAWPARDAESLRLLDGAAIEIISKADALRGEAGRLAVSAKTGQGLSELLAAIESRLAALAGGGESPAITRARHVAQVEQTLMHLERLLEMPLPLELQCEELRLAAKALGEITGKIHVEELLDVIFKEFCIGK